MTLSDPPVGSAIGPPLKLTERAIAELACPAGRKDRLVFDDRVRGLAVRVSASGNKTFLAQYTIAGRKRRVPLGAFGAVTLEQARRHAIEILGQVAGGRDPALERKARTAVERSETLGQLVAAWAADRAGDLRPRTLLEAERSLRRNLAALWDRPAASITPSDAVHALDAIRTAGHAVDANRTRAYGSTVYAWAQQRQRLSANPFTGLKGSRERSRDRVLEGWEIGAIWRACGDLPPVWTAYFRVLLLTLQRRGEVAGATWDELTPDFAEWRIPAARTKNHRPHVVHLSEPVREILAAAPRFTRTLFIFTNNGKTPIAGFAAAKHEVDVVIERQSGRRLAPWVLHDFRRSGVSWMAATGIAPHVADKVLNHATGTISGVAAIYQRHELMAERRAALDAWAAHVLAAAAAG